MHSLAVRFFCSNLQSSVPSLSSNEAAPLHSSTAIVLKTDSGFGRTSLIGVLN
jgi:hypothetical protein